MISEILNNAVYFSLLLIFLSSIIGVFLRIRARDRCLRDFHNFSTRVELKSGKIIWGKIQVYGTGIELEYPEECEDSDGFFKNSYILYNSEIKKLQVIYRYHDELTEKNKERRKKDIKRTYRPTIISLTRRKLRNFFNTFRDGINQTFTLFLGTMSSGRPKSTLATKKKDLGGLGSQVITTVSNSFDPIVEQYIGQYVVVEMAVGEEIREIYGILKEYTEQFVELLNVLSAENVQLDLPDMCQEISHRSLTVTRDTGIIQITNTGAAPVYIRQLKYADTIKPVRQELAESGSMDLSVPDESVPITLTASFVRQVDLIIPREIGVIRHAGRKYRHSLETLLGLERHSENPEAQFVFDRDIVELSSELNTESHETIDNN